MRLTATIGRLQSSTAKVGYTGGMNIADYYINGLPKIGTWRDMHIRIEGDAVKRSFKKSSSTIWNKDHQAEHREEKLIFLNHQEQTDSANIVVAIVDRTPKQE